MVIWYARMRVIHMEKVIDYNKNPFIVIWEVTRACQLKCVHCRADAQLKSRIQVN